MHSALSALEARRQEVNDLNVFPVPDGDTGDNMALTLRAVADELDRLAGQGAIDEIGRDEIVDSVARAALLGARGNSGVILSQLIRGAAEELISRPGELVDPVLVSAAMARAAERGYASMRSPSEGTILTVMREMALGVATQLAHIDEPRLPADTTAGEQDESLAGLLESAVATGQDSVRRTPDLLPILRESGVVDAGGYGLVIVFAGVVAALRGSAPPEVEHHSPAAVASQPQHESETHRYCTNFVVTGRALRDVDWERRLEGLGDSVLVVGDRATLRVHVHTDDPEAACAVFADAGELSRLDVADMHGQVRERAERLAQPEARCGVLAVCAGDGLSKAFRSLGAMPLYGGPTLNPSTYDLLAGVHAVAAPEVVILPNSGNVLMTAQRAAELSDKVVRVVPSRSVQAGLTAAFEHDPASSADVNAARMSTALERVRTAGVAGAARDDAEGRYRSGDAVGFVDEELLAWGEPAATLAHVMRELSREGAELVTCIAGKDAPLDESSVTALGPAHVELEFSVGGQDNWWWLLSAE